MNVNGYEIIGELKSDNSGFAKWGFAKKDGVEVFIKEFLSPVYPEDTAALSPEQIARKRRICMDFEKNKRSFYSELNKCVTGNIVTVSDFFRWGSRYYIVTDKVDTATIKVSGVARFSLDRKLLIIKIILYCMRTLHRHGIVHGDIKPDNILLKRTASGAYTAKIIDFDSSFLESAPPNSSEEFQGDLVYLAPESFALVAELDEAPALDRKVDVFALGVLFHQYFTGELPGLDPDYEYAFESVLDGKMPKISPLVPDEWRVLLTSMLCADPARRPDVEEIYSYAYGERKKPAVPDEAPSPAPHSKLKSTMRSSGAVSDAPPVAAADAPAAPPAKKASSDFFKKADEL